MTDEQGARRRKMTIGLVVGLGLLGLILGRLAMNAVLPEPGAGRSGGGIPLGPVEMLVFHVVPSLVGAAVGYVVARVLGRREPAD